jgi:hypothetical protein
MAARLFRLFNTKKKRLFRLKITFYKKFCGLFRLKITFYKKFCILLVFCRYLAQFNPSISACFVFVFYSSLRFWWYNYFCTSSTSSTFRSILTSQFANFDISKTFCSISTILRILVHDRKFCRVLDDYCRSWCL